MMYLTLAPADLQAVLIMGLYPGPRIIPSLTAVGNYARLGASTDDDALVEAVKKA